MRVHYSLCGGFFVLSLLSTVSFSNADPSKTFEVVGVGECADCGEHHFKTSQAFSGLRVSIDCKLDDEKIERIGFGELDDEGKFNVQIPETLVEDGKKLKKECYAQLHSAGAVVCPAHDGLEASKIVFKTQTKDLYTFSPCKNLKFSAALCSSKFFWPIFKFPPHPFDPWKKHYHWFLPPPVPIYKPEPPVHKPEPPVPIHKPEPPVYKPPVPVYKPKPPVYKPPVPVYKPPVPVQKPKPPVYKPPVPVYKPEPPVPVYKPEPPVHKPEPPVYKPPVPVYKPKPPVYKPPVPVYKPEPPVYKPKPEPPVYKPKPKPPVHKPKPKPPVHKPKPEPPVHKPKPEPPVYTPKPEPPVVTKPLPPATPYYPPVIKKPCPPVPKLPPKYFNHPKFGHFPPLPPYHP